MGNYFHKLDIRHFRTVIHNKRKKNKKSPAIAQALHLKLYGLYGLYPKCSTVREEFKEPNNFSELKKQR